MSVVAALREKFAGSSCHGGRSEKSSGLDQVAIVGSPNVGKSVIFNRLTGVYVTVSNYPGTTVEVSRGKSRIADREVEVLDTPGMYSLLPITEEERVARSILLEGKPRVVVHVVDAKNLDRMLSLTLQLLEAGLRLILVLNIMDEAEELGMRIDLAALEAELGIPVVATVSTSGRGIDALRARLARELGQSDGASRRDFSVPYSQAVESALAQIGALLQADYQVSKRAVSLLLLQGDEEIEERVAMKESEPTRQAIQETLVAFRSAQREPAVYTTAMSRQSAAKAIVGRTSTLPQQARIGFRETLSRLTMHPLTGLPILFAVLYFGLYKFVGGFGAGTVVDFLEGNVFGEHINPWVTKFVTGLIPWPLLRELFVGDYGMITLGIRYAVALILPIVTTFFIAFSVIEDSGYLPRLALLIDRVFKKIGLNGRAVIPMTLGFGCDTMATMVTRTLETKRERIIASFLLALAIPCSAQLGVILALLAGHPRALLVWAGVMAANFLLIGYLTARVMPGRGPTFFIEVPPLRLPKLSNVITKTYTRVEWYFKEIFPLFILASLLIWVGRATGLFDLIIRGMEPLVRAIGLPDQSAVAFLFGFFRRDYGAAGLYDLQKSGLLSGTQLAVATVTLALFVPCIAQFSMTIKERGIKAALAMSAFIFPYAFLAGFLLNLLLVALRVRL